MIYRNSHDKFSARCRVLGLVLLTWGCMHFPALAATTSVTLVWNPLADPSVAGYNIYYGGSSHLYTNELTVGRATNVTISGLIEGTTYHFAATTYSALGMESPFSSELVYLVPLVAIANQAPTLDAINDLTIAQNSRQQTVSLSDITSGSTTENQTLSVTAFSSDPTLIPNPTVNYNSPNTSGSLAFTPMANANGTAIITVTVNDGQTRNNTTIRRFAVTVAANIALFSFINPLSNLVVVAGQTVTIRTTSIAATSLSYQWKLNGTNLVSVTGPTLTLNNIATNQAGVYSVTASSGKNSTSQAFTLTVYATTAARLAPSTHASGQYALAVAGVPGFKYVVQASTNLVTWIPLQTNTAPFTFVDVNAGNFQQRFYRSVYAP